MLYVIVIVSYFVSVDDYGITRLIIRMAFSHSAAALRSFEVALKWPCILLFIFYESSAAYGLSAFEGGASKPRYAP